MDLQLTNENYVKNTFGYWVFRLSISTAWAATGGTLNIASVGLDFANFDLSKRLRCYLRYPTKPYLTFYSATSCIVDTTNGWMTMTYAPIGAVQAILINTLVELVVRVD